MSATHDIGAATGTVLRALLVDMDGTLVDTARANHGAYAAALAEVGVTVTREAFDRACQGRNWRQFLPGLLAAGGSAADPADVARRKAALYPDFMPEVEVNRALVAWLAASRAHLRTALVTTASAANAHLILDHFGLRGLFDLVVTGDQVSRHKPDPSAYVLAAERLGVGPTECVVVEDSDIGISAGQAFGAAVLGVRWVRAGVTDPPETWG